MNKITKRDVYPLPRISDLLDSLGKAKFFTCLDLVSGYWQIPVHPADKEKTAFVSFAGLFQFRVMPFGLASAGATFQRTMELALAGLQWNSCLPYLDDIIIYSETFQKHLDDIESVLQRFQKHKLKIKLKKCSFCCKEVKFLGHIVSAKGITPDPEKVQAVRNYPVPKSVKQVRQFLGLSSYYRRFVANFATIAGPLHQLLEKERKWVWTENRQKAFEILIDKLVNFPILAYPDFSKPFILMTDASDFGIGAVLGQIQDGAERVIAYASKALTSAVRNWHTQEKEAFATIWATKYFRPYLYGSNFIIKTDHKSLQWAISNSDHPNPRIRRWSQYMSEFEGRYKIEYRKGKANANADALSRVLEDQKSEPAEQPEKAEIQFTVSNEQTSTSTCTANLISALQFCKDYGSAFRELPEIDLLQVGEFLRREQEKDPDLLKLIKYFRQGVVPPGKSQAYNLKRKATRFTLAGGILFRYPDLWSRDSTEFPAQIVVPASFRREVLEACHDHPLAGHTGVNRTLQKC